MTNEELQKILKRFPKTAKVWGAKYNDKDGNYFKEFLKGDMAISTSAHQSWCLLLRGDSIHKNIEDETKYIYLGREVQEND